LNIGIGVISCSVIPSEAKRSRGIFPQRSSPREKGPSAALGAT